MGIQSSIQSTQAVGGLGSQEVVATAGSSINAGDLVVNSESGTIFAVSNQLSIAQNNNSVAGPSVITALTGISNNTITMTRSPAIAAQLNSGNMALTYSSGSSLVITFRNLLGTATVPTITINENVNSHRIRRINTTSFVVVWSTGTTLRFAIYNNDGSVIVSPTTISSVAQSEATFNVACLNNGNIVVAFTGASNAMSYAVYNSTGGTVVATTSIEASASPSNVIVLPQSNGGFLIYYYRSASTAAWKFARYDSTGTIQGTLTTVVTTNGGFTAGAIDDNLAIQLTNDNIVFQATDSSGWARLYVYTSTGTLVTGAIDVVSNSTTFGKQATTLGICETSFGFAVVSIGNTTTSETLSTYNFSGISLSFRTTVAYTLPILPISHQSIRIFNNGIAGYTIYKTIQNLTTTSDKGGTYYNYTGNVILMSINPSGSALRGAAIVLRSFNQVLTNNSALDTGMMTSSYAVVTFDGSIVPIHTYRNPTSTSLTQYSYAIYAMLRKSIVGVALETVATGQNIRIGSIGTYTLTQSFSSGTSFDQRTATIPGSKGIVIGSTAILNGFN